MMFCTVVSFPPGAWVWVLKLIVQSLRLSFLLYFVANNFSFITPTKRSNTSPPVHIVKSIRLLHGEGLDDA